MLLVCIANIHKKSTAITNAFQIMLDKSKLDKIWVDIGSEFLRKINEIIFEE